MIKRLFFRTREDGVNLYRTYSTLTPKINQLPTNVIYDCWQYKVDENGEQTTEVDWDNSGVIDVENTPYSYEEVFEETLTEKE